MFEELNILNNLYELQKSINDKDDLILINNLIEKREKGFLNLKQYAKHPAVTSMRKIKITLCPIVFICL